LVGEKAIDQAAGIAIRTPSTVAPTARIAEFRNGFR
jgi:hypothetical protein